MVNVRGTPVIWQFTSAEKEGFEKQIKKIVKAHGEVWYF